MAQPMRPGRGGAPSQAEAERRNDILEAGLGEAYHRITRLAAALAGTDIAFLLFAEPGRQRLVSPVGIDRAELPADDPLGAAALAGDGVQIVADARADPRYRTSLLATGAPGVRFWASAPVTVAEGAGRAALCVAHPRARASPGADLARDLDDLAGLAAVEMERRSAARQREAAESELRALADILPIQISFVDRDLTYRFINQRYIDWYGRPDIVGRRMEDVLTPTALSRALPNVLRALGGEPVTYENVVTRADGTVRHVLVNVVPHRGGGEVDGAYLASVDISSQKEAGEKLRLLNAELDHRLRNVLATVQALIARLAPTSASPQDMADNLHSRVSALARAHEIIHLAQDGGLNLQDIFESQFAPFLTERASALDCGGPRLSLTPLAGLALATATHEMVVNSLKYGALSSAEGRVSVRWRLGNGDWPRLELEWKEHGGPPVASPRARGYGADAIERLLAYDIGAQSRLAFEPDGLRWTLSAPLSRIADAPACAATAPRPARAAPGQTGTIAGKRILVAEDSAHVALSLEASLQAEGAIVIGPAATVEEARRLAASEALDMAVVDVNLNEEMSFPLIEELIDRQIEVVVATGYDLPRQFPGRVARAPVLKKPFTTDQLIRLLKTRCGRPA